MPLGYKGTITAVHTITDPNPVRLESVRKTDVLYEVLFDRPFDEGNTVENVAEKRFLNVPPIYLLNITHGLKLQNVTKTAESVQPAIAIDKKNIWEQLKRSNENKKNLNSNHNAVAVAAPQLKINNLNQQANNKMPTNQQRPDESDMLRKLLKIQQNNQTEPTVIPTAIPTAINHENSTKINVSDLFRVDPAHPPKPPLNWHSQKTNRNKVFPQAENSQPKSNNHFYPQQTTKPNYIHHPRPNSAAHRSPIHNDVNFSISNQVRRRSVNLLSGDPFVYPTHIMHPLHANSPFPLHSRRYYLRKVRVVHRISEYIFLDITARSSHYKPLEVLPSLLRNQTM